MHSIVAHLLYGLATAITGSATTWWLCWSQFRRKTRAQNSAEDRRAARVLSRLHELATRVAVDVDEHSSQVERINDTLTTDGSHEPATIVGVVASLIQSNQHMQAKLTSTEEKLRDQAQQIQAYATEARTDALTLLTNRRAFDAELARRIDEFHRQRKTFSLTMADVDRFKEFNDTHGHQTGDAVLRGVARLLRRQTRDMDVVARYGGEEFAMLLPGTNLDDASKQAMRACEAIEKWPFRHEEKELRVTMSFGVAEVRENEDEATLVARADKALYAAKEGGRNCTYRHDGETVRRVVDNHEHVLRGPKRQQQSGPAPCEPGKIEKGGPPWAADNTEPKPDLPRPVELDSVSGPSCRTTFCQQVRNRTAEWKRGGPTFSVILIEVNQYEQAGEHRDRQAREAATMAATRFLTATASKMGILGYYRPGCFALLLSTAGLTDAIEVAEQLREGFSRYNPSSQGDQPRLTLSVGVVQVMERDDLISLLTRAEAALDAADRRGGNRAYYHDGECCGPITAILETMDSLA